MAILSMYRTVRVAFKNNSRSVPGKKFMMLHLDLLETLLVFIVVGAAACVQGSVGFGLAMIAAPILLLIDKRFVPGPLVLNVLFLAALITYRERRSLKIVQIPWVTMGSVLGSILAVAALCAVNERGFSVMFGSLVLIAVVLSISGWHISLNKRNAVLAGLTSGFMGTTSSIGGPPLALLYQHQRASRIRADLSALIFLSSLFTLAALAFVGRLGALELKLSILLLPGLIVGFAISAVTSQLLAQRRIRPAILTISATSGVVILIRALA